MRTSSTLKFIMNISFVPSISIHRSIILIFIEKKYACRFFPWKFSVQFSILISVRILVSVMNSRLWLQSLEYDLDLHKQQQITAKTNNRLFRDKLFLL